MMHKVNCQHIDRVYFCKHKKVKRRLFGLLARTCIEYRSNKICEFKTPWPKPKISFVPPHTHKSNLVLFCCMCKRKINTPGALLFSPPKDINVKKHHICCGCYAVLLKYIASGEIQK